MSHLFFFDSILPLQHPFPCSYISEESHRATKLPDSITGLLMPAFDCRRNNERGRNQDSNNFVPHH